MVTFKQFIKENSNEKIENLIANQINLHQDGSKHSFDLNINYQGLETLPDLRSIEVHGGFNCAGNPLKSLENSPLFVGGYFDCSYTNIVNFVGISREIGRNLSCFDVQSLETFKGLEHVKVGREVYIEGTPLNKLLPQMPTNFPGKDIPKWIAAEKLARQYGSEAGQIINDL